MPDLPPRLTAALFDRYRIERELGARGVKARMTTRVDDPCLAVVISHRI